MAPTATAIYQDSIDSQYLSASLSGLSQSRSTNSFIVRVYRQATQLYLTRQFKDALEILEPIVTPQGIQDGPLNGHPNAAGAALVAQSSRGTRTKVWVFYLSLINAIIELGPEEGRNIFGIAKWRQIAAKAREGTVWDEVVRGGYGGVDGEVDPDVVVNLATLLLGHMPTQQLNQQKLEAWLASSAENPGMPFGEGIGSPLPPGAQTPKALATRLRVLELYALHILPLNEEWDYAESFIEMNDTLDEESKEAFMNALENLKEEKDDNARREHELKEQREREMEDQKREEEAKRAEAARKEEERRKAAELERQHQPISPPGSSKSVSSQGPSSRPKAAKKPRAPPPSLYHRASSVFNNLQHNFQHMVFQASRGMNRMSIMRLLMFVLAFLVILARRDLRMKIRRVVEDGWVKMKQTVGMGVTVSYI